MQRLRDGQRDGAADAAADDTYFFQPVQLGGNPKRPNKVVQVLAFVFVVQFFRCCTDNLKNNPHRALFGAGTGDGQRNPLAVLIHPQNDELTRTRFFRDERRFDVHHRDGRIQAFFRSNSIHT